jgi:hypothetical protein
MTTGFLQEIKFARMGSNFEIGEAKNHATGRDKFFGFHETLPNRIRKAMGDRYAKLYR